jgi:Domain of unknown function (DUF1929)/Legume lectin domain/Glyoxal oxidase N-terminus
MSKSKHLLVINLCLLSGLFTQFAPPARSQAKVSAQGQWQTLPYTMPINPVHATLLHTGKVLIVSGSGNVPENKNFQAAIWDPQSGTITQQPVDFDMFCNGMVTLFDGRPFVLGGTIQYDPFLGDVRTSVFDPLTNIFTDQQSMVHGRWYPTATTLGDGRIMVFSGLNENNATNTAVEIYTVGQGWSPEIVAPWTPPLYPRMHLLPNGKVFYSGETTISKYFNPSNNNWTLNVATTNYGGKRTYGSSVLLPLTPASGYKPKVMILGGGNPSTLTTEIIDLSATTPKWVYGPNMSQPRIEMDATLLPNGKVLANGGSLNDEDTTTASTNADLYDPIANTFSSAGTEAFPRLYHSVTLLMPDATVWVAGSNPVRRTYEPHMEIYSPPYLFNPDGTPAIRPAITSVSSTLVGYGSGFQVQTTDAANITSVVLMRNGASTHAFDMEQRYVGLNFSAGSGVLNVTGPPNGNIAPPGYYMLFILNAAGVPSVAIMVQVSFAANDRPPTGTITSPASDVNILAGQSVSYSGTGMDPDGTVTGYSWVFPGGSPSSSNLSVPGNVVYNMPGTYVTSFTVTDNVGLTDPHPPTRTITVSPAPFSVSLSPSTQSVSQGSSLNYTTTVTTTGGFTGNISFSVTGLPSGASASFSPVSVAAPGSSTMSISTSASTPTGSYVLTVSGVSGTLKYNGTATLVVGAVGGTVAINFGSGFSAAGMQFNGHTKLNGNRLGLTDTSTLTQVASAFWTTAVNVQSFTNDFTFQLTNPNADGFTFVIQSVGLTAMGNSGGSLGYQPIPSSAAVKFDLFNSHGEGNNSTGLYLNGASPSVPATTLGGGVNLHSGDIFQVHMTYDGTNLTMTITDTVVPADTFTISFPVNIPAAVGGNTAFVGFTAGTGTLTATQEILTWAYSTGTSSIPDFSISASPASQTVNPGKSTSYTVSIGAQGGFTGAVNLAATGLPAGASASFSPASVTGSGTSTLTVTTAGSTPAGSSTITMTATSGSLTHGTAASLIVAIPVVPDFSIATSPASQTVNPGNSTTYTVTIGALNGFTGVVNLAATGLPTGASASFSPASVTGSGTSTLTVTTAGSTPAGTSTITMTATSGSLTHGTAASLIVAIPVVPDFSIATSPASQTVNPGNSTTYTVTIGALNGFTGAVNLAASGLPSGATASFSLATVTGSGTSTLTVTTAGNTPVGTSRITITGASGSLTHTTTINLVVQTSTTLIDFGSGFSAVGMQFNGHTKLNGTRLGLTDSTTLTQVASAFWTTGVNVQSFTNDFTFQLTNPNADGFTFTIQSVGLTALGNSGGSLGYQPIPSSAAVKFDLFNGHGEGNNSTGLYLNGASPSVPATTLGGGVNLHSGDIFQVHMTYDGTNLTMTITDTVVPADTFTISFPVNIPAAVGGNTAFVGFTAGTGSLTATQEILTWTYRH